MGVIRLDQGLGGVEAPAALGPGSLRTRGASGAHRARAGRSRVSWGDDGGSDGSGDGTPCLPVISAGFGGVRA